MAYIEKKETGEEVTINGETFRTGTASIQSNKIISYIDDPEILKEASEKLLYMSVDKQREYLEECGLKPVTRDIGHSRIEITAHDLSAEALKSKFEQLIKDQEKWINRPEQTKDKERDTSFASEGIEAISMAEMKKRDDNGKPEHNGHNPSGESEIKTSPEQPTTSTGGGPAYNERIVQSPVNDIAV